MLRDVLGGRLEQLRHLRLRQPDRIALEAALDARSAILGLVKDQFGAAPGVITGHPDLGRPRDEAGATMSGPVNVMMFGEEPTGRRAARHRRAGRRNTALRVKSYAFGIIREPTVGARRDEGKFDAASRARSADPGSLEWVRATMLAPSSEVEPARSRAKPGRSRTRWHTERRPGTARRLHVPRSAVRQRLARARAS
jgi:hypothetical protein